MNVIPVMASFKLRNHRTSLPQCCVGVGTASYNNCVGKNDLSKRYYLFQHITCQLCKFNTHLSLFVLEDKHKRYETAINEIITLNHIQNAVSALKRADRL